MWYNLLQYWFQIKQFNGPRDNECLWRSFAAILVFILLFRAIFVPNRGRWRGWFLFSKILCIFRLRIFRLSWCIHHVFRWSIGWSQLATSQLLSALRHRRLRHRAAWVRQLIYLSSSADSVLWLTILSLLILIALRALTRLPRGMVHYRISINIFCDKNVI